MRYAKIIRPPIEQWEDKDNPILTQQLISLYIEIILEKKLNPLEYEPILDWHLNGDDFAQNRITLRITAKPKE